MEPRKILHVPDESKMIKAQELLQENEPISIELRQGVGLGSYVIDLTTGTWKVSPELYKIFGIDETVLHTLDGWVGLLHPDSREKCIEYHSHEESEITRIDYQCRIVRINDGAERLVHGLEEVEYDDHKNPIRHVGTIQDITECKWTEEQRLLMQATMNCLPEAIFWVDPSARFLYVNDAACRLLGYSRNELLSLSVPDIDPNFSVEAWPAHWAELKQQGSFRFESKHRTKGGATLQTEVIVNYFQAGEGESICAIMRDITERNQAKEALEELALAVTNTMPGISVLDLHGCYERVNDEYARMMGFRPGELVGGGWESTVVPDDIPQAQAAYQRMLFTGRGEFEAQAIRKDGSRFFKQLLMVKRTDASGNFIGHHCFMRDITERKLREKQTQRSEAFLRQVIDINPNLVFVKDREGQFTLANKALADVYGTTVENLIGKTDAAFNGNLDEVEHFRRIDLKVMDTLQEHVISEEKITDATGQMRWLQTVKRPIEGEDGRVNHVLGVATDITALKLADSRLRRTQYAVDHATDCIFVIGQGGHFLDVNESACRRLGYTKQELLAKTMMDIDPDFPGTSWNIFWEGLKYTKFLRFETRHRGKSGETYPVEVVANYVLHEGAELQYAFVRDISERKQAEAALQVFHDQIRQMQKMEAIGELASGIAHDFNHVLTAISGNAQLACKKVASDHPLQPNLIRILEASDRASRLVQQILTFSHQQASSRTLMALSPVVNEALDLLRATLPAGIQLTATFDAATPQVLADATQIHQVLMNLCTNAWHALKGQSGDIVVDLAAVRLTQPLHSHFATLPPGHYACLSVRDTGCGMESETVTRIFEPFYTTKPVGHGTGLGLSVVHGIVRGHEGAIVVDSYPGRGTTISIYFPAAEARAYAGEPVNDSPVEAQGRLRHLLYLDDEGMLVDLVRVWFEPRGYRVTGCLLASEALDMVRADPTGFDVVVTDYNMPGMSGLQVAQALACIRASLPVVLVSGQLFPSAQAASLASNIKAMVSKATIWQQLEGVINRLLSTPPEA